MSMLGEMVVQIRADASGVAAGVKQAKQEVQGLGDSATSSSGGVKSLLGSMLSMAGGIGIAQMAGNAFGFLKNQITDVMAQGMSQQAVMADTVNTLRTMGDASGQTAESIGDYADKMARLTGVQDDVIQHGENVMLTFGNIGKTVFPEATTAALNMSVKLGTDLQSSIIQVGKALNDPIKGVTALSRVGVSFSAQEKDQIATMMQHNDIAGAQAVVMSELNKQFAGAAETAGNTFGGQLKRLNVTVDQAKEKIGLALIPALSGLLTNAMPLITAFGDALPGALAAAQGPLSTIGTVAKGCATGLGEVVSAGRTVISFFQGHQAALDALGGVLTAVAAGALYWGITTMVTLVPALWAQAAAAGAAAIATMAAAAPFLAVGAAIALVAFGILELVQHWSQVQAFFGNIVGAVGTFLGRVGGALKDGGLKLLELYTWPYREAWTLIQAALGWVTSAVTNGTHAVLSAFRWLYEHNTYVQQMVDGIRALFTGALVFITTLWTTVTTWLLGTWQTIATDALTGWTAVTSVISTALTAAWSLISGTWNTVVGFLVGIGVSILTTVTNDWNSVLGFLGGLAGRAGGAVKAGVIDPITGVLGGLAGEALHWGENLIAMLAQGITQGAGKVGSAAKNIASSIGNFLGFHSPTKEGPGSDADTWMPNLGTMLAHGLVGQQDKVRTAAQGIAAKLAGPLQGVPQLALAASGTGRGGSTGATGSSGNTQNTRHVTYNVTIQGGGNLTPDGVAAALKRMEQTGI